MLAGEYANLTSYQVNPRSSITLDKFAGNNAQFVWNVSENQIWLPSRSRFMIKATLEVSDGKAWRAPMVSDAVSFAPQAPSTLFSAVELRRAGTAISSQTHFVPQAAAIRTRAFTSQARVDSNKYMDYSDQFAGWRENQIASNGGDDNERVMFKEPYVSGAEHKLDIVNGEVKVTGTNTSWADGTTGSPILRIGDWFHYNTDAGVNKVRKVVSITSNTQFLMDIVEDVKHDNVNISRFSFSRPRPSDRINTVLMVYMPAVGLSYLDAAKYMEAGEYTWSMTTDASFMKACVSSPNNLIMDTITVPGSVRVVIKDMTYYAAIADRPIASPSIMSEPLMITEIDVSQREYGTLLDFVVPVSSYAFAVFIQDSKAGRDNRFSPTQFTDLNNHNQKIRRLAITYGNKTKPGTVYTSVYDDTTEAKRETGYIQRYYDTFSSTGTLLSAGGAENYQDWSKSPFFYFNWAKGKDTSTNLQMEIVMENTPTPGDIRVYLAAFYTKQIVITSQNGHTTSVNSIVA